MLSLPDRNEIVIFKLINNKKRAFQLCGVRIPTELQQSRMYKIGLLVLCLSAGVAFGSYCDDISGLWQNELGSNMTIVHLSGNRITGEYSTAVESKRGASLITSNITGIITPLAGDGALFAFTVLFNHGKSLTTWVGQCMVCNEEETLFTTWTLQTHLPKPTDKWMSSHINRDTFKRVPTSPNSIPRNLRLMGPTKKDERSRSCEKNLKADLGGHWVSESDDAVRFEECFESGFFSGTYGDSSLSGRTDGGGSFTALGFVSSTAKQVKGWTGHIYETLRESNRKIEASWIVHSFSNNCKDPRRSATFGKKDYMFTLNYKNAKKEEKSMATRFFNYIWSSVF